MLFVPYVIIIPKFSKMTTEEKENMSSFRDKSTTAEKLTITIIRGKSTNVSNNDHQAKQAKNKKQ